MKKALLSLVLCLAICISGTLTAFAAPLDVNNDSKVNSLDAAMILKADAGLVTLTDRQKDAADANCDGKVNSLDAAYILKADAGLININQSLIGSWGYSETAEGITVGMVFTFKEQGIGYITVSIGDGKDKIEESMWMRYTADGKNLVIDEAGEKLQLKYYFNPKGVVFTDGQEPVELLPVATPAEPIEEQLLSGAWLTYTADGASVISFDGEGICYSSDSYSYEVWQFDYTIDGETVTIKNGSENTSYIYSYSPEGDKLSLNNNGNIKTYTAIPVLEYMDVWGTWEYTKPGVGKCVYTFSDDGMVEGTEGSTQKLGSYYFDNNMLYIDFENDSVAPMVCYVTYGEYSIQMHWVYSSTEKYILTYKG